MGYKTPLTIYIMWHPDYLDGQKIADYLYQILCRNPEKPLVRSLGIPVYFRNKNWSTLSCPTDVNFSESDYTAIVPLISDEFINDRNYGKYLEQLNETCSTDKGKRRIYPVALSKHAFNVSKEFAPINFIRVNKNVSDCGENGNNTVQEQIKSSLLHELCRLLMDINRVSDEKDSLTVSPPIKLFISHSKHDESMLDAIKFRDYINSQTQVKTFFDANDIAFGINFGEEIKKVAKESALVVFQSDSYADREWCRIEVLTAKSASCPIVIVNAIKNGEKRAFPYLGNYPSIRFKENYQSIIDLTLEQVLFNKYTEKILASLRDLYNAQTSSILTNVPELFDFIELRKNKTSGVECSLVIYPDPPLGSEELDILNQLDNDFVFVTPLLLPSLKRKE